MSKFIPFHGVLKDDKRNASVPCGQSAAGQPQFLFRWRPWWGLWETIIFWALRVVQRDVVLPVLRGICWRWNQQSPENLFQTNNDHLPQWTSLQQRTYRKAVVLQQVSQDLHQGRERGPLFGLAMPAGQHDAVSTSRGQHRHNRGDTDSTTNLLIYPL